MRKKGFKKWIVTSAVTAVLALAVVVCWKTDVFGKFTPEEPFVKGQSTNASTTIKVTDEGSNWKGEEGTGKPPSSTEVPTCEGEKGSATNPFVVLEIVADHAQQQMPYLNMDTDAKKPFDIMQIGLDIQEKWEKEGQQYTYAPNAYGKRMTDEQLKVLGQWFSKWKYSVYKIGGNGEKENIRLAEIGKLYSLTFSSEDLVANKVDPAAFNAQFNKGKFSKYNANNLIDMKSLIDAYPKLFVKDGEGKEIRQEAKEDNNNWDVTCKEHVVAKEEVSEHYKGSGYIVAVEPGKGDFGFASEDDAKNWIFTKTGTNADRWKYVTDASQLDADYVQYDKDGKAKLGDTWFYNNVTGVGHTNNMGDMYTKYNESAAVTGMFLDLSKCNWRDVRYIISPEEYKDIYTFDYYGVYSNNILKRQLFVFADQNEYDNFHLQVITKTPAELNAMEDKDDTVDLIERADMFYVGDYVSETKDGKTATNNITNVYEIYYKYVLKQDTYDISNIKTFRENDLDWNLCYKIVKRLCDNVNLPLIMTQTLGLMVDEGVDSVEMYHTKSKPNLTRRGTLNNLAKLYIIGTQFDLTAKKTDGEYKRTFAEDLLDKLETIDLAGGAISNESTTPAKHTGYYKRPMVIPVPKDEKGLISENDKKRQEKCYYLWNMMTFFPYDYTEEEKENQAKLESVFVNDTINQNSALDDKMIDFFVKYGYMRSFFKSNGTQVNNTLTDGDATHKDGSDGTTGNVAIPHNNGSYVYSTLLGNTESYEFFNNLMHATYLIMNNRPDKVNKQEVKVMKQKNEYVKMTDTSVLVDYVSVKKYGDKKSYISEKKYGDKKSYIKVKINTNKNAKDGLVTDITLKDEDGKTAPSNAKLKLYSDKACTQECEKATYGKYSGYNISMSSELIAYIPYSLAQWAVGYNQIEVTTVGRIYSIKKEQIIVGKPEATTISVGERTLFNLE